MTNTKFRKRALLSSVAMLLVALVALGSATFAWFAEKPTAEAHGIKVKTTAAAGLDVKTDTDSTFSKSAALASGQQEAFNLTPASQVQASPSTFYTIIANTSDNFAAKDATGTTFGTVTAGRQTSNGVYSENVYFQLSAGAAATAERNVQLTGVTITKNTNATMYGTIRVAVVNQSGAIIGTFAITGAQENDTIPAGADGKTYTQACGASGANLVEFNPALVTGSSGAALSPVAPAGEGATVPLAATGVTTTSANSKFVTVYVWMDGQDTNCKTDAVNTTYDVSEIISSIQVDFSLTAA